MAAVAAPPRAVPVEPAPATPAPAAAAPARRKLGYNESRELAQLPQRIEALEARIAELGHALQEPAFYQREAAAIVAANDELSSLQRELDAAYARWSELDG